MDPRATNYKAETELENEIISKEQVMNISDPVSLDIPDDELADVIDDRIEQSKKFYNKIDLYNRRKKNETYLFGRQVAERENRKELKKYESRVNDNVIYEIEASIKPLAMNRLPDMLVTPGNESDESKQTAKDVSIAVNSDIKKRANRKVLSLGFKHLPAGFVGVIKTRWNPELGNNGDYVFENVHYDNIIMDHTATTSNADEMNYVGQYLPITVQELIMRFPDKKNDLFEVLRQEGVKIDSDNPSWKSLATELKIMEVWFTWYKSSDGNIATTKNQLIEEPGVKWEKIEGVVWKYKKLIFKKMKNPNFDYEGETKFFTYQVPGDKNTKKALKPEEMMGMMATGILPDTVTKETVYRNYFESPRKPFFFMTYDQWGKMPLDETSRIEQNLFNQENLDKRNKQINDTLSNRIKHIWSKDSGLKAEDIQSMDMDDPKLDVLVDGNVNEVHTAILPERPTAQEFADSNNSRQRMYAIAGSTAVRGELQSDTATSNQIAREADFTRADDLVEDTINAAAEWMSQWSLQFIKLRYTEDHFRKLLGNKGSVTFLKLHRDMIDDGMEVLIKASGTDKIKAQRNAMDMAKAGLIDPLTFFEDMDLPDPEGRTERLLTFQNDPATYIAKFVKKMENTPAMVDQLLGQGASQQLQQTPPVAPPMAPTATDTSAVPVTPPAIPEGSPRGL